MAFVDVLAFEIATLLLVAVTLTYVAVVGYFSMRRNDPDGLKHQLKAAAIPVGGVGFAAALLGFWGEVSWPLPGSYNILFSDVYLLFGLVLVAFAFVAYHGLRLQFAGLFAMVAGVVTIVYGFSAYQLGLTQDPLEMLLLYTGFGVAGIASLPATVVVDRFLHHPLTGPVFWSGVSPSPVARARGLGSRAVQRLEPVGSGPTSTATVPRFGLPRYVSAMVLVFPVLMILAGIAAAVFLGNTVPSHLTHAP